MQPEMLLLAERLVTAAERISEDVKEMSTYVFEISCSVAILLEEKRQMVDASLEHFDETTGAEQETSVECQLTTEREMADRRSQSNIDEFENDESMLEDGDSSRIDHSKNVHVLPVFSEGIKREVRTDLEEDEQSCNWHNGYINERNIVRQVTESTYPFLITEENIEIDDHTMYAKNPPEEQPTTQQMESANDSSVVHTKVRREEKLHKYSVCEKLFKAPKGLQGHTRVHSGQSAYVCQECGKAFSYNYALKVHVRSHTGERPFKCNTCGKAFSRKGDLGVHMRKHLGVKPYICTLCNKAFSHNSTLRVHMRTHTGEKPEKCALCGKSYSNTTALASHIRFHTGEKPHKCTLCEKEFTQKITLKQHVLIHTGEKPYRCTFCGKAFRQKSGFTRHMRTHNAD